VGFDQQSKPCLPVLPDGIHIIGLAGTLQPTDEARRCRSNAGARVEPRHLHLAYLDRSLVARDESKQEHDDPKPECAFEYGEELTGNIRGSQKTQRTESRTA